jgi:dihydrofolate synthase/folylpolyglutamate synthase
MDSERAYNAALDYLYSFVDYSLKHSSELAKADFSLDRMRALMAELGNPQDRYPVIHVAGTKGKGSVCALVEAGLRAGGYRVGLYTSPHLLDYCERIQLDRQSVSHAGLVGLVDQIKLAVARIPKLTTFEITTALGFLYFAHAGVDAAVIEVGLGGRLDATNVVTPVGVAITAIDVDHERYLGSTIEQIAGEKAGVIKPGSVVVLAANPPAAERVVRDAATRTGAFLVHATEGVSMSWEMEEGRARLSLTTPRRAYPPLTLALRGRHQVENAVTAVRLLEELSARGAFDVPEAAVADALTRVEWPARLEHVRWRGHTVVIDGAHNPAGARALASYLSETYGRRVPIVVGIMRDKKIDQMIGALAPVASYFVFTAASSGRAASPAELAAVARRVAPAVPYSESVSPIDALDAATAHGDPIVVAGSLYLAGEVRYSSTTLPMPPAADV